jgi:phospholipid-binding lipoprotein MlaA
VRDVFGFAADQFTDPKNYLKDPYLSAGLTLAALVDTRAELLAADDVLQSSFDPYVFMRNAYLQRREFQVKDGKPPADDSFEIFEDESGGAGPAPDSNQ